MIEIPTVIDLITPSILVKVELEMKIRKTYEDLWLRWGEQITSEFQKEIPPESGVAITYPPKYVIYNLQQDISEYVDIVFKFLIDNDLYNPITMTYESPIIDEELITEYYPIIQFNSPNTLMSEKVKYILTETNTLMRTFACILLAINVNLGPHILTFRTQKEVISEGSVIEDIYVTVHETGVDFLDVFNYKHSSTYTLSSLKDSSELSIIKSKFQEFKNGKR